MGGLTAQSVRGKACFSLFNTSGVPSSRNVRKNATNASHCGALSESCHRPQSCKGKLSALARGRCSQILTRDHQAGRPGLVRSFVVVGDSARSLFAFPKPARLVRAVNEQTYVLHRQHAATCGRIKRRTRSGVRIYHRELRYGSALHRP